MEELKALEQLYFVTRSVNTTAENHEKLLQMYNVIRTKLESIKEEQK